MNPPSDDELRQADELRQGHPWQLTYKDFLRKVCADFGFERREKAHFVHGTIVRSPYLRKLDGSRVVHLPATLTDEEQLDEVTTASLCRRIGVDERLFGLTPEEPYDGDSDLDD